MAQWPPYLRAALWLLMLGSLVFALGTLVAVAFAKLAPRNFLMMGLVATAPYLAAWLVMTTPRWWQPWLVLPLLAPLPFLGGFGLFLVVPVVNAVAAPEWVLPIFATVVPAAVTGLGLHVAHALTGMKDHHWRWFAIHLCGGAAAGALLLGFTKAGWLAAPSLIFLPHASVSAGFLISTDAFVLHWRRWVIFAGAAIGTAQMWLLP